MLQSKYSRVFSVESKQVIELYGLYIKFANTRKNGTGACTQRNCCRSTSRSRSRPPTAPWRSSTSCYDLTTRPIVSSSSRISSASSSISSSAGTTAGSRKGRINVIRYSIFARQCMWSRGPRRCRRTSLISQYRWSRFGSTPHWLLTKRRRLIES